MSYLEVGKNFNLLVLLVVVVIVTKIVVVFCCSLLLIEGDYCVGLLFDTVYLLSEWGLLIVVVLF